MKVYVKEITLRTNAKYQLIDITSDVEKIVRESGVKNCLLYTSPSPRDS